MAPSVCVCFMCEVNVKLTDKIVAGDVILSMYTSYASGAPVTTAVIVENGVTRFLYGSVAETLARSVRRRMFVRGMWA